ncbi:MAG: Gfo/Idh/MocA family oxidoreductase [Deltaproteobacteria bacterium]|nr:Gfo/Idh/MocA family oxidoreductase [Deltaproteobacteria bacterium]
MGSGKLKVGVIGVGYLGRYHAEKYAKMKDVELVGVADNSPGRAKEIAAGLHTRMFSDYHELLKLVDAASIVVPTKNHFQVAMDCLEYGLDILIEKPITKSISEADAIVSKARSCHRIVQVGHIERFNPAVMAMEQYLDKPIFIEAQRLHAFSPRGTDVDVTLDLMIHDLDIVMSIANSPIKHIHAIGSPVITDTSDLANARLLFENGCCANLTASRVSKTNTRKLRIFQKQSYISLDFNKKEIWISKQIAGKNGSPPQEKTDLFSFASQDALETELKAFILNVRQRTRPIVSAKEGRLALKVALQIIEQINDFRLEHRELFNA